MSHRNRIMEPSERVNLITKIADKLSQNDWGVIDLTLRQFGLPWTDQWSGGTKDYVINMIEGAQDQVLQDLAQHIGLSLEALKNPEISPSEAQTLLQQLEKQKGLMINVSTGGQRIQEVNEEYKVRQVEIRAKLLSFRILDPNPYSDLWAWYGKWSDGSLPSYQSRRKYLSDLFQPTLEKVHLIAQKKNPSMQVIEPTGWARVDRNIDKISQTLQLARNEEDFQSVGLLCREAIISLAQAVYSPNLHPSFDGVKPSETDAKRMLESYIATELSGSSNEEMRKYVKDAYQLAVLLQHKRNASFREAALCAEATRSLTNTISIIAGRRDP